MHYIYKCLCKQTSELNQFAENNQISLLPEAMDNTVNNRAARYIACDSHAYLFSEDGSVISRKFASAQTHHFTS